MKILKNNNKCGKIYQVQTLFQKSSDLSILQMHGNSIVREQLYTKQNFYILGPIISLASRAPEFCQSSQKSSAVSWEAPRGWGRNSPCGITVLALQSTRLPSTEQSQQRPMEKYGCCPKQHIRTCSESAQFRTSSYCTRRQRTGFKYTQKQHRTGYWQQNRPSS